MPRSEALLRSDYTMKIFQRFCDKSMPHWDKVINCAVIGTIATFGGGILVGGGLLLGNMGDGLAAFAGLIGIAGLFLGGLFTEEAINMAKEGER